MAVLNLQNREKRNSMRQGPNRVFTKDIQGEGSPVGDSNMQNRKEWPVGTTYLDLSGGIMYYVKPFEDSETEIWAPLNAPAEE